jgi:hypothetical protein
MNGFFVQNKLLKFLLENSNKIFNTYTLSLTVPITSPSKRATQAASGVKPAFHPNFKPDPAFVSIIHQVCSYR